jgi:hypothetical protein
VNQHNNWYLIRKAKRRKLDPDAEVPAELRSLGKTLVEVNKLGTRYYARNKAGTLPDSRPQDRGDIPSECNPPLTKDETGTCGASEGGETGRGGVEAQLRESLFRPKLSKSGEES